MNKSCQALAECYDTKELLKAKTFWQVLVLDNETVVDEMV